VNCSDHRRRKIGRRNEEEEEVKGEEKGEGEEGEEEGQEDEVEEILLDWLGTLPSYSGSSVSILDENDHHTNFSWFLVYFPYFAKEVKGL
jgi:hypothetical protein